jgi:hypothetical protein
VKRYNEFVVRTRWSFALSLNAGGSGLNGKLVFVLAGFDADCTSVLIYSVVPPVRKKV